MIKCSASLAFYLFFSSHLLNSIKHDHSCKILYICTANLHRCVLSPIHNYSCLFCSNFKFCTFTLIFTIHFIAIFNQKANLNGHYWFFWSTSHHTQCLKSLCLGQYWSSQVDIASRVMLNTVLLLTSFLIFP